MFLKGVVGRSKIKMVAHPVSPRPLSGRRVLVIEDEYFLADDIVRALTALGAGVVGPYGDLAEATHALEGDITIDAAIVDVNLWNEIVFPLARILRSRQVPFVFTTGYDRSSITPEFDDVRLCSKPLDVKSLARELSTMIKRN
jgi:DNA-binding response OmpR family regulator